MKLEQHNFKIDSTGWTKKHDDYSGIDYLENPEGDVWEIASGELKGEQLFTWDSAMRETKKAGKRIPTDEQLSEILATKSDMPKLTGYRYTDGSFNNLGTDAYFWSSSQSGSSAWYRSLGSGNATVHRYLNSKAYGFSCRCLKQNHRNWDGTDDGGYHLIHERIRKIKGKPEKCCVCGKKDRWLNWANIDHKYSDNPDDYISLCPKCHRDYDVKNNLRNKFLKYKNNKSGITGVYFIKRLSKWTAELKIDGKRFCSRYFDKKEDAINQRKLFEDEHLRCLKDKQPRDSKGRFKSKYEKAFNDLSSPLEIYNEFLKVVFGESRPVAISPIKVELQKTTYKLSQGDFSIYASVGKKGKISIKKPNGFIDFVFEKSDPKTVKAIGELIIKASEL